MRHSRLPVALLTAAITLAAPASGQDLRERLLAATQIQGREGAAAVLALNLTKVPVGEFVALLSDDSPLLQGFPWQRMSRYVRHRRHELMKLWHSDAGVRANNTQLFAKMSVDWTQEHAVAGPQTRANIETLATHFVYTAKRVEQMKSADKEIAASAETLQRIAAKAAIARANARLEAAHQKTPGARIAITDPRDPFSSAAHITSTNPVARSAAANLTRRLLGLPIAHSARNVHPSFRMRDQRINHKPHKGQLERYLQRIARGQTARLTELGDLRDLPVNLRREAARKLIAIGGALPPRRDAATGLTPMPPQEIFRDALRLAPGVRATLLTLVEQSNDATVRAGAVMSLMDGNVPTTPVDDAILLSLMPLLDSDDLAIRAQVAAVLDHHLHSNTGVNVRDNYRQRAKHILAKDANELRANGPFRGSCTVDAPMPGPANLQSRIVTSAARLGVTELIDPLTDLLVQSETEQHSQQQLFLWQTLALLASHANAKQATRLFKLAAAEQTGTAEAQMARSHWRQHILAAIYGVVPEGLLDTIDKLRPAKRHLRVWPKNGYASPARSRPMPAARARRLLRQQGVLATFDSSHYARCPDLLLTAWRDGTGHEKAKAVQHVATMWTKHRKTTMQMLLSWPSAFTTAVVVELHRRSDHPERLSTVPLQVVQRVQGELTKGVVLAEILDHCSIATADIDAATRLANKLRPHESIAVARRLHTLGDKGREAARILIDKNLQHDRHSIVNMALEAATTMQLRSCKWQPAADRITRDYALTADIARVLLGAMKLEDCTAGLASVIVSTRSEVDAAGLEKMEIDLPDLIRRHNQLPATTTKAALQLIAQHADWSQAERIAVTQATLSEHPSVRRAAYVALSTRDRELWPIAWLVYEAALDPDASVRAVAPDAKLMQEGK